MKICRDAECPLAGQEQPLESFTVEKRNTDGLAYKCRACSRRHVNNMRARKKAGQLAGTTAAPVAESVSTPAAPPIPKDVPKFDRDVSGRRAYIITAAQNNTLARPDFLAALQRCAERKNAEIIVVPFRYKNPTGHDPGADLRAEDRCELAGKENGCCLRRSHGGRCRQDELWWDPALKPYLLSTRKQLFPSLVLAADVKIQPTASSPLSGFESLTGPESCVIGHPKLQLRTVAVPTGRLPKILTTTGAVTEKNYSNTKAGALGEFHYTLGAALVEQDEHGAVHLRQLLGNRNDGSFTDLEWHYTAFGPSRAPRARGLALADLHVRWIDPQVEAATFGPGGIVETLDPEWLIAHDLQDGYSANPHHKGKPFISIAKARAKLGDVRAEVELTVGKLVEWARGRRAIVVPSNHDNFLERWVETTDWRNDPGNAEFYLETALVMARSVTTNTGGATWVDPFAYWVDRLTDGAENIRSLKADESFSLEGIEVGMHGHWGPNGARGSVKNLSRLGTRTITGHGHSPAIEEGHWRVGTSTPLRLEYTHGPGSWLNTHCVVYASGKRALITILDGRWRA